MDLELQAVRDEASVQTNRLADRVLKSLSSSHCHVFFTAFEEPLPRNSISVQKPTSWHHCSIAAQYYYGIFLQLLSKETTLSHTYKQRLTHIKKKLILVCLSWCFCNIIGRQMWAGGSLSGSGILGVCLKREDRGIENTEESQTSASLIRSEGTPVHKS